MRPPGMPRRRAPVLPAPPRPVFTVDATLFGNDYHDSLKREAPARRVLGSSRRRRLRFRRGRIGALGDLGSAATDGREGLPSRRVGVHLPGPSPRGPSRGPRPRVPRRARADRSRSGARLRALSRPASWTPSPAPAARRPGARCRCSSRACSASRRSGAARPSPGPGVVLFRVRRDFLERRAARIKLPEDRSAIASRPQAQPRPRAGAPPRAALGRRSRARDRPHGRAARPRGRLHRCAAPKKLPECPCLARARRELAAGLRAASADRAARVDSGWGRRCSFLEKTLEATPGAGSASSFRRPPGSAAGHPSIFPRR
jgi:hypothetical protein